ncbi:alpha/beta hydrolase [Candidatus Woesearchaeota archaeon]|nr:alpha/beta hydrolase [Candidatus Woesearchaeota archaeon]
MENLTFSDVNGNKLLGTLSIPARAESVVIMSHGFQSSKESKLYRELEYELNQVGIGTFRYDAYGHGPLYCKGQAHRVSRDVSLSKWIDSLGAAIAFVRSKGEYDIGLMGSSFGALVSFIVASQDPNIKALALKSPVTEPIEFWKQRLGNEKIAKWKQEGIMHYADHGENFQLDYGFWEDLNTFTTLEMAKSIICPVLIVHGGSDTVVPIKQSQELAEIVKTEVKVVKGANHNYADPSQYEEMKQVITAFLVGTLSH